MGITGAQRIFFTGVLMLTLSTVVELLHVHTCLKGQTSVNMQKTGNFHVRKAEKNNEI